DHVWDPDAWAVLDLQRREVLDGFVVRRGPALGPQRLLDVLGRGAGVHAGQTLQHIAVMHLKLEKDRRSARVVGEHVQRPPGLTNTGASDEQHQLTGCGPTLGGPVYESVPGGDSRDVRGRPGNQVLTDVG